MFSLKTLKWPEVVEKAALFFVLGILAGAVNLDLFGQGLFFLLSFLIFLFCLSKDKRFLVLLGLLCLSFLGFFYFQKDLKKTERPDLEGFFDQKDTWKGRVVGEVETLSFKKNFVVEIEELGAKARVSDHLYPVVASGDVVLLEGKLVKPEPFNGFNYPFYLRRQGIYFLIKYPEVEVLKKSSFWDAPFLRIKSIFKDAFGRVYPSPARGFFEALVFGEEENIPYEWKERLNETGTRHIAAVSGTNITILSGILLSSLVSFGAARGRAFWATLLFILSYVFLIGAPACGVRAGIMGGLLLLATKMGRIPDAERVAVLSAFFMLLFSPLDILDVGFQLSFLAFLGLLFLNKPLEDVFSFLPEVLGTRENLVTTLSAQVFVLPLLLYNFGRFSIVSPLSNLLILSLVPFLTIWGAFSALVSFVSAGLARVLALPSRLGLRFVLWIVKLSSRVPFASVKVKISFLMAAGAYLFLFLFIFYLKNKHFSKGLIFDKIKEKN